MVRTHSHHTHQLRPPLTPPLPSPRPPVVSTKTFFAQGVCCKPKGPPRTSIWRAQAKADDPVNEAGVVKEGAHDVKRIAVIVNPNAGVKKGASNLEICQKVWASWRTVNMEEIEVVRRSTRLRGGMRRTTVEFVWL